MLPVLSSRAQDFNLDQFFNNQQTPSELNIPSVARLDSIYKSYLIKKGIEKDKKGEYEKFVYQYNYFIEQLNRSGKIFYNNEISDYLNVLKDRILADSDQKNVISVRLTNFPDMNAFTNDFGIIFVNVSTVARVESEDQLMIILAHEISHILLEHSYNLENLRNRFEEKQKIDKMNEMTQLEYHQYSRAHELEADSLAYKLLENIGVDISHAKTLLHLLDLSDLSPLIGKVDPEVLFFGNPRMVAYYNRIYNDSIIDFDIASLEPLEFDEDDKDSTLRTHPSIESRIQRFEEWYPGAHNPTYPDNVTFDYINELAMRVFLKCLMTNNQFDEALYLTANLRSNYPDEEFLIKQQLKLMLLITQQKYSPELNAYILNILGPSNDDLEYHKFRNTLIRIPALEMNLMTRKLCQDVMETGKLKDPYLERIISYCDQFLYKNNAYLFKSSGGKIVLNPQYDKNLLASVTVVHYFTTEQLKTQSKLQKKNYYFIDTLFQDLALTDDIITNFTDIDVLNKNIQTYRDQRKAFERTLSVNQFDVDFYPKTAFSKYKKGDYTYNQPITNFENIHLFTAESIVVGKELGNDYEFDVKKSLELTAQIESIWNEEIIPVQFVANSSAGAKISNAENYTRHVLSTLFDESWSLSNLVYSSVDEELYNYKNATGAEYIALNLNLFLDRQRNASYYSMYLIIVDLESMGIVYTGKVANSGKTSTQYMKHLIYKLVYGAA